MSEYQFYYNHYLEGYEKAKILCTGDTLAIRETRRIVCEYMMTVNDYLSQHSFADEIGRYCYPIDIHSHTTGVKEETAGFYQRDYEKGRSYGISYRSLLPKNTGNLLVAGRCMGAERGIMGSLRVMPGCFITGMAAGIAAVESINQERSLRELDIISLGPFQALCHGQLA